MKITWITDTTGRVYVNGNFIGYAHKEKESGKVIYNSTF